MGTAALSEGWCPSLREEGVAEESFGQEIRMGLRELAYRVP